MKRRHNPLAFEERLMSRTRFKKHKHCFELIKANALLAPLWERLCLAAYISIGPPLAGLFGANTSGIFERADQIIADILAVTQLGPERVARFLREYVKLRTERDAHLPFDEAREQIYDQSFYPIVTHFTYAMQPSAAARLKFVRQVVQSIRAECASVADLGCGSGVILSEILMLKPHWLGHGLDISHEAIKYARKLAAHKRVATRASFHAGNITSLPYADESLDLVVASEIIEHMPEPLKVIGEIRRVLRAGGKLILTMPVESHTPAHIHTLSNGEELRSLCEQSGFRVRQLEPHWHFGFGDDRKHVFMLAEAGVRAQRNDYVSPDALQNFASGYPEPETV
jgi:SAM-dependent methyltransferase